MDPKFNDPNNHVPEVAPGDDWDDPAAAAVRLPASLPPRRAGGGEGEAAGRDADTPPLRIEPKRKRRDSQPAHNADPAVRLEVQELGKEPAASEQAAPRPIVARQAVETPAAAEEPADEWRPTAGEGREWGTGTPAGSMRWMAYWGLGIAFLLIAALVLKALFGGDAPARASQMLPQIDGFVAAEEPMIDESDPVLLLESGSRDAYAAYVRAASIDEVVGRVRDGERLRGVLEREWTPLAVPQRWEPAESMSNQIFQNEERTYASVTGLLPDFSPLEAYVVVEDGRPTVDWEATTGRGTATFEELGRGEGDASFIRGALVLADFYTAAFPEAEYQSFRFISADPDRAIWVYSRRGSEAEEAVFNLFRPGAILDAVQSEYRVCLALARGGENPLPNQWEIRELLHIDWVRP